MKALAGFFLLLASSAAAEAPLPRKILAFYDRSAISGGFKDEFFTDIHQRAEMPLNYLGMEVVYRDLAEPLPEIRELKDYRGVLLWFEAPKSFAPAPFCRWSSRALDAGLKLVILGSIPFAEGSEEGETPEECRRVLSRLGVSFDGIREPNPVTLEIPAGPHPMAEFERKLSPEELEQVPRIDALPGATSYLSVLLREPPEEKSDPIAISAAGGIALNPFVMYENKEFEPNQLRWRLDPFAFFEAAFGLQGRPRPDLTTVNGRRLFFSQIDGDSFFNPSETDRRKWSAQVFLEEILLARPDTPFTASVIAGYYDLTRFSSPQSLALSRRILGLPNVEPATHGYAHPLLWWRKTLAVEIPGYRFDPAKEVEASADLIDERLLSGRKTGLFLWTGDALPPESALAAAAKRGLRNLNGGWTRFDRLYDSYTGVAPIGRKLGGFRQIYAPDSNEEVYTELWHGPFYGFRDVVETFDRTESPRRVAPVDVYVHYYSAEKIASLIVLKRIYDWARGQPLFPVHAGEYSEMAQDFFDMRLVPQGSDGWRLEGGAKLRTVRFDGERRTPDLSRSKGVLGWKRFQGSLYVFLDESGERELFLAARPPELPHIVEANFGVRAWRSEDGAVRFEKNGWWKGELELGGLKPSSRYRVSEKGSGRELESDREGMLRVEFPDSERGGPSRAVTVEASP
ncbi:MAG: hypothetical protein HY077_09090 [Elusimicrobia bacterium]|nr:hypothetical protein [Elusimicrobiota bacterium]